MSSHREINVTCPQCHKENSCVIWSSINTALDPEMKKAVRDRSAFQFICPDCGARTTLVYGFLYHQMEDHIMIQYAASDEAAEEEVPEELLSFQTGPPIPLLPGP